MKRAPDPVKLRKLYRQAGRRLTVRGRYPAKVTHTATLVVLPPEGRQVYPRLGYKLDCGTSPLGMRPADYERGVHPPPCKRCARARR